MSISGKTRKCLVSFIVDIPVEFKVKMFQGAHVEENGKVRYTVDCTMYHTTWKIEELKDVAKHGCVFWKKCNHGEFCPSNTMNCPDRVIQEEVNDILESEKLDYGIETGDLQARQMLSDRRVEITIENPSLDDGTGKTTIKYLDEPDLKMRGKTMLVNLRNTPTLNVTHKKNWRTCKRKFNDDDIECKGCSEFSECYKMRGDQ
jgi:hypothetical protein